MSKIDFFARTRMVVRKSKKIGNRLETVRKKSKIRKSQKLYGIVEKSKSRKLKKMRKSKIGDDSKITQRRR